MKFSHRSLLVIFFFCGAFLQAGKWENPLHVGYGTNHKIIIDGKGNSIAVWKAGSDRKSFIQVGLLPVGAAEWKILHIAPRIESDIFYTSPTVVLNKNGEHGAFCLLPGFNYAAYDQSGNRLIDSSSYFQS